MTEQLTSWPEFYLFLNNVSKETVLSLFYRLSTTKSSNKFDKKNYKKMSSEESTEIDIDIKINNVQCTFNVRCLLNIEDIIERGVNVELRKNRDRIKMQLRF